MAQRVLGIGTDIIFIPRISHLLKRFPPNGSSFQRLISKFMHQHELNVLEHLLDQKKDPTTYLAGIWATKECLWKAMASFIDPKLLPPAMCVYTKLSYKTKGYTGVPLLTFDSNFPRHIPSHSQFYKEIIHDKSLRALLSISHDKDYLIAFITLVQDTN